MGEGDTTSANMLVLSLLALGTVASVLGGGIQDDKLEALEDKLQKYPSIAEVDRFLEDKRARCPSQETKYKRQLYKFTVMTKGKKGLTSVIDKKTPCWWDNSKKICAKCKKGSKPCGFPMHRYCQPKKSKKGCPGIVNREYTLSSRGYPCYNDLSDKSCAWCKRGRAQCRRNQKSRCGNFCAPANDLPCDGVPTTCLNIPWCGNGAKCKSGKCVCSKPFVGNGMQCRNPKTGEFAANPSDQVQISIESEAKFFVFAGNQSSVDEL